MSVVATPAHRDAVIGSSDKLLVAGSVQPIGRVIAPDGLIRHGNAAGHGEFAATAL
jgi:hypothetical protein